MRPLAYFVAITSVAAILSRPMEWPMALSLLAALVLWLSLRNTKEIPNESR